ncbi:MAG: glutathione S-transferase family protein [Variibacter sp.]|nr:glutathione S-transferase family protein [Variibacter sp.]
MARVLYDLAGAEPERRFSPYCWRTKLALAHKKLAFETIPWRFTEKDAIAFSGQGRVPVLVDGERIVFDSWTIANYLEDAYPQAPSLFGGSACRAVTRMVNSWADTVLLGAVARVVLLDIYAHLHEKDRAYFRESREQRFGKRLEEVVADREGNVAALRAALEPVRVTLRAQPYLGGESPLYADYIVFGMLQWARCISPVPLLAADDPVAAWRERLLDAFDGLARRAPAYAV